MVVNGDGRGKLPLLDKQLLSGEAANTHTHTHSADPESPTSRRTARNSWNVGCGNNADGKEISGLLAVALSERPNGYEQSPADGETERRSAIRKPYNPDPRIADYESGEEAFAWFTDAFH